MGHPTISIFTDRQIGKVIATLTLPNLVDRILANRRFIPKQDVRTVTLNDIVVDTGVTILCLSADIIHQLDLALLGEIDTATATGVGKACVFKTVSLAVAGREGIFDCLELPSGQPSLLGAIPMERLGLEPDRRRQKLRTLLMNVVETYMTM